MEHKLSNPGLSNESVPEVKEITTILVKLGSIKFVEHH
jgi:hypothetical protein